MGIQDQVIRLLSDLDAIETEQRLAQEWGKALLLHSGTQAYVDCVSKRDWQKARGYLKQIIRVANLMIIDLPEDQSGDRLVE